MSFQMAHVPMFCDIYIRRYFQTNAYRYLWTTLYLRYVCLAHVLL